MALRPTTAGRARNAVRLSTPLHECMSGRRVMRTQTLTNTISSTSAVLCGPPFPSHTARGREQRHEYRRWWRKGGDEATIRDAPTRKAGKRTQCDVWASGRRERQAPERERGGAACEARHSRRRISKGVHSSPRGCWFGEGWLEPTRKFFFGMPRAVLFCGSHCQPIARVPDRWW